MTDENTTKPMREQIVDAALAGNLALLRDLAQRGAAMNEVTPGGDSLLEDVLTYLYDHQAAHRYAVVRTLLELGADPNVLGEEKSSPLVPAMLNMDTEMLRILLDAGADPNKAVGFMDCESFYDWAEFDYRYEMCDLHLPDTPTEDDKKDEDSWLSFLDKVAVKHNWRRPDHLFLLRMYGAKTRTEIKGIEQGSADTERQTDGVG
jgi:hypothetical protein